MSRLVWKTCPTAGCGTVYRGPQQRVYCPACIVTRAAARKALEPADLTDAQVDQRFAEALATIKRDRTYTIDEAWSMDWRYS